MTLGYKEWESERVREIERECEKKGESGKAMTLTKIRRASQMNLRGTGFAY